MLLLLIFIIVVCAFFVAGIHGDSKNISEKPRGRFAGWLLSFVLAIILVFLPAIWSDFWLLEIVLGVLYILLALGLAGVIPGARWNNAPAEAFGRIYLPFCGLVAGISDVPLVFSAWMPLFFLLLFVLFFKAWQTLPRKLFKNKQNVKELLELNRQLLVIFTLILGMVTATDRVRFLEKFINWLF